MSYALDYPIAARAPADERASFIRRTYGHLAGAILAFTALEALLLQLPNVEQIVNAMMMSSRYSWLIVVGAFVGVSWLANAWAQSSTSRGLQYAGLALYVAAEAFIFLPILYIAQHFYPNAIPTAGILTLAIFGGLTAAVLVTRRNFSFLGPVLAIASLLSLGFIVAGAIFGFNHLGLWFCFAMVALACGYILYDTSNVLHQYRTDQHVAAALALFASVALLFYYILMIVMSSNRRN